MGVFENKYQQWDIFRGFGKTVSHKNRNRLKKPRALAPAFHFSGGIPAGSKLANAESEVFLFGSISSKIVNHAKNCTVWVVE